MNMYTIIIRNCKVKCSLLIVVGVLLFLLEVNCDNFTQKYPWDTFQTRENRLISFHTLNEGDIQLELEFHVPFLTIPVKKTMSGALANINIGAIALTGAIVFGAVVALPGLLALLNKKGGEWTSSPFKSVSDSDTNNMMNDMESKFNNTSAMKNDSDGENSANENKENSSNKSKSSEKKNRRYPITGIPIAGLCTSTSYCLATPHNVNLLLYSILFSDAPLVASLRPIDPRIGYRSSSLDRHRDRLYDSTVSLNQRQNRYERKLNKGFRSSLGPSKIVPLESRSLELKQQVCDMMKSGRRMSESEARRTFSQYLNCVLRRISSSPEQEDHVEVVLKFLQQASNYLRTPFSVKVPSHKLTRKDRAAIIAKQLNDFLYLYNRETELYSTVLERPNQIPRKIFSDFLENAREVDLQEILKQQNFNPAIKPQRRCDVATLIPLIKNEI